MSPQCWHLTSKCDLDLWGTDLGLAHATRTDEDECICEIILNSIEKSQSNGPDKLKLSQFWPLTSKCDLDLWGTDLIRKHAAPTDDEECICEIIFKFHWEISVMVRTSWIWANFDIWPPSVTLTFEVQTWFLRMPHRLMMRNAYVKYFLNSIEKYQSYGPDKLNLSKFWHLTSKCDLDLWGTDLILAHAAPTDDEECICEIIFKFHWEISELWSGQAQFEQILTFDLKVWPWPLRYRPDSCACRTDWWWGMHMWNNF
jgi:hypothetical protein